MLYDDTPHEPTGPVEDDRLRLLLTCCHSGLAPEARIALTLGLLGGLSMAEIAQAFLVPETTMAQRITRAKKKIASANVQPFHDSPGPAAWQAIGAKTLQICANAHKSGLKDK